MTKRDKEKALTIKLYKQGKTPETIKKKTGFFLSDIKRYINTTKFPKMICHKCGEVNQLKFDPRLNWRKTKGTSCKKCGVDLFQKRTLGY